MTGIDGSATFWASLISAVLLLAHIAICVAALGVIPGNRKPSTGMAWLILILAVPFLGLVAFLLFGTTSVERRRHDKQRHVNNLVRQRTAAIPLDNATSDWRSAHASAATLNRNLGTLPVVAGNTVELHADYDGYLAAMSDAVDEAQHFVHVEFYICAWDTTTSDFFDALVRARTRGVTVRVLFDHLGSRKGAGYREMLGRLDAAGIAWRAMLVIAPLRGKVRRPDLRNHRKILVVDNTTAFMGSQNLIETTYGSTKNRREGREYVELNARVRGPVVPELNLVFATDWYSETDEILAGELRPPEAYAGSTAGSTAGPVACQVLPSGPGFATENNLRLFTTLIYSARTRLSITSPYFVPDESLLYAITTAAQRGVEVELFVSAQADQFMVGHAQSSYYEELLDAGVRIYLYPAPRILHSKHFSVDDEVAVIGSSNMDMRSFGLNYEVIIMMVGGDLVARMRAAEDNYRALSRLLTADEWRARSWSSRFVDNLMRLTAAIQ
jgi:cardiolipin synthase A/B